MTHIRSGSPGRISRRRDPDRSIPVLVRDRTSHDSFGIFFRRQQWNIVTATSAPEYHQNQGIQKGEIMSENGNNPDQAGWAPTGQSGSSEGGDKAFDASNAPGPGPWA